MKPSRNSKLCVGVAKAVDPPQTRKKLDSHQRSKVKFASYRWGSEAAGRHYVDGCLRLYWRCSRLLAPQVLPEVQVAMPNLRAELRLLSALGSGGAWWRFRTGDVSKSLMAPAGSALHDEAATWRPTFSPPTSRFSYFVVRQQVFWVVTPP